MKQANQGVLRRLGKIFAWLVILIVLLHAGASFFLSQINHFNEKIAGKLGNALSSKVSIEYMTGSMGLWNPRLMLRGIVLENREGVPVQKIGVLKATIALFPSLFSRSLVIKTANIENASLIVTKHKKHWFAEGVPNRSGSKKSGSGLDSDMGIMSALANINGVSVEDSKVYFVDPAHASTNTLTVSTASIQRDGRQVLANGHLLFNHSPVKVTAIMNGFFTSLDKAKLEASLSSSSFEAAPWIFLLLPASSHVHVGSFPLKADMKFDWSDHRWHLHSKFSAPDSMITVNDSPVSIQHLKASFITEGKSLDTLTGEMRVSDFMINDIEYPTSIMKLEKKPVEGRGSVTKIILPETNLNALKRGVLASGLLSEKLEKTIRTLNPFGTLKNTVITIPSGQQSNTPTFSAELENLSVEAWHGIPAAKNISGSLSFTPHHGVLDVDSKNAFLHLRHLFPHAWHYESIAGQLQWKLDDNRLLLSLSDLLLRDDEKKGENTGRGSVDMTLDIPRDDRPARMNLNASLYGYETRQVMEYLPSRVMEPKLVQWLRQATPEGKLVKGTFQWDGSLENEHSSRLPWKLSLNLENTRFHYSPDWPDLDSLKAKVEIDAKGLNVTEASGRMYKSSLTDIHASIKNFEKSHLQLSASANIAGNDFARILQTPVISGALHQAPMGWKTDGNFKTRITLGLPLSEHDNEKPSISVSTKTHDGRFEIPKQQVVISGMKGSIEYSTEKGLSSRKISARFLNNPATLSIENEQLGENDHITYVNVKSHAGIQDFKAFVPHSLTGLIEGDFDYAMRLGIPVKGGYFLDMSSDLKGATLHLPKPFAKTKEQERNFYLLVTPEKKEGEKFLARYGGLIKASFTVHDKQMKSGMMILNPSKDKSQNTLKENGFLLSGSLDVLDLKEWQAWYKNHVPKFSAKGKGKSEMPLTVSNLHLGQVRYNEYTAEQVTVNGKINGGAEGNSDLKKTVTTPLKDSDKVLSVEVGILDLPANSIKALTHDHNENGSEKARISPPRGLPSMRVLAKKITMGKKDVGHASFILTESPKRLDIKNIDLSLGGLGISGALIWHTSSDEKMKTEFNGVLKTVNLRQVFKNWDYSSHNFTAKEAEVTSQITWTGTPLDFDFTRSKGHANLLFKNGQINGTGNTASLHIFGLFNVNTIARRLQLDFSDLFDSGITFDSIKGEIGFDHGLVDLEKALVIDGPSSSFILNGAVNLTEKSLDLGMIVTLPLTQNLPVITLLLGQPAIAGAIYLFDKLAGKKLMKFSSVRYEIEGPFSNPKVTMDKLFSNKLKKGVSSSAKNEAKELDGKQTATEEEKPNPQSVR